MLQLLLAELGELECAWAGGGASAAQSAILAICSSSLEMRSSWLVIVSFMDFSSFKISSNLASFCWKARGEGCALGGRTGAPDARVAGWGRARDARRAQAPRRLWTCWSSRSLPTLMTLWLWHSAHGAALPAAAGPAPRTHWTGVCSLTAFKDLLDWQLSLPRLHISLYPVSPPITDFPNRLLDLRSQGCICPAVCARFYTKKGVRGSPPRQAGGWDQQPSCPWCHCSPRPSTGRETSPGTAQLADHPHSGPPTGTQGPGVTHARALL